MGRQRVATSRAGSYRRCYISSSSADQRREGDAWAWLDLQRNGSGCLGLNNNFGVCCVQMRRQCTKAEEQCLNACCALCINALTVQCKARLQHPCDVHNASIWSKISKGHPSVLRKPVAKWLFWTPFIVARANAWGTANASIAESDFSRGVKGDGRGWLPFQSRAHSEIASTLRQWFIEGQHVHVIYIIFQFHGEQW